MLGLDFGERSVFRWEDFAGYAEDSVAMVIIEEVGEGFFCGLGMKRGTRRVRTRLREERGLSR